NNPSRLVLFDNSEFALYSIETELKTKFGAQVEIIPILGSVCRKKRVLAALRSLQINTVYHAAAYKHVPMVEHNPFEGIRNNVSGTFRTAEAAIEAGVDTFVFISTDKAVRPTNIMGASKRIAEIILQAFTERGATTRFTMVRFGNVLDSSGSVVPLFRQQIKTDGPVTVTHHDVVRYFMTIPEAVQLVLQAAGMGKGGDVFVLDMGEPVRILDMAKKMIRLSGLTVRDNENPAGDIAIEFTGLRPGEKLFEELLIGDNVIGTEHPMIMRAKENFLPWNELKQLIDEIEETCLHYDYDKLRDLLQKTVSGYLPHKEHVDPLWQMDSQNTANSPTKKRSSIQWLKKSLRV
ncbi:MAG: polysaccharide biosynthesis protein, partial [Desulfobulbaceae bacterium]|nr:polysaccharide biosynthesis protein [Desulfobulbaceae bacterium]